MSARSTTTSPALAFLSHAWEHSNYPSHRQKNATMQGTLRIATESGMKFDVGDIGRIYTLFRASWWIGQSDEGYYSRAVEAKNLTACRAWEHYFDRPALLWPEKSAKPELLHIGSLITWEGLQLKITSFNNAEAHLIACGPSEQDDKKTLRKKITFTELQEARKTADKRVKEWVKRITATKNDEQFREEIEQLSQAHTLKSFRHFDLETLTAATATHAKQMELSLSSKDQIDRWRSGETHSLRFSLSHEQNYLRIKGNMVEVSNGNSVLVSEAKALFKVIQPFRSKGWKRPADVRDSAFTIADHPLKEVTSKHVTIGCTTLLWSEIDLLKL